MFVQAIDSTSLQVNWEPVPPTEAKMVGYRLYVYDLNGKELRHFIFLVDDTQHVINKLGKLSHLFLGVFFRSILCICWLNYIETFVNHRHIFTLSLQ